MSATLLDRGPVLLVGADGQLGTELRKALAARGVVPLMSALHGRLPDGGSARACDLSVPGALAALVAELKPAVVLNAAAYTAVDRAESEPALARRINADAVGELGAVARAVGAVVVHYSTDYVFAGDGSRPYREDDAPGPVSVYGRTKLEGEQALAASGAEAVTFRLAWVYAAHSANFLRTMLRVGAEREHLRVVADQIGAPTPAHWIADASLRALEAGARGLYHLAPQGETSWHAYAEAIFAGAVSRGLLPRAPVVEAIASTEYPTPAARPAWSVLDSGKLARDAGLRLGHWRKGLDEVLDQLATAS
ncbi:dTDP-4-dehydrorhamnose reductase [Silanimonas lenta]|uniref:dTDP-4-dehydrorhamnose reductase n=1 Tax=Silanimonas lenta TaxID=265429 RepID=UPI00056A0201|nr:dTDP-4-dehydrorhamnose reductase [Silanimonas lenta]